LYHSTLGLRVIKKKKKVHGPSASGGRGAPPTGRPSNRCGRMLSERLTRFQTSTPSSKPTHVQSQHTHQSQHTSIQVREGGEDSADVVEGLQLLGSELLYSG